jgi:hypothetical protein
VLDDDDALQAGALDDDALQNRRAERTAEPGCSTTSRTRRFARVAERRAAPVPDVACARRWIAFATGAGTRRSTTGVSPDRLSLALPLADRRCTVDGRMPTQREHHAELETGETRSRT